VATHASGFAHGVAGALDRRRGTVEQRQRAVARRLHHASAEALDRLGDGVMMVLVPARTGRMTVGSTWVPC